jgi:ABC-type cobalamin/Fe3+-siderophores transport system ATPase subunit
MVSHDIERALSYADSVIEISNGEVVFTGNPSNFKLGGER